MSTFGRFEVLDAADPAQRERWIAVWGGWLEREVFAHPGYVELFSSGRDRALCAIQPLSDGWVLYPFIYRTLPSEIVDEGVPSAADITTAYGYGGPYAWGALDSEATEGFWNNFEKWATANHVVSEFIRFDLQANALLPYPGKKISRAVNIVRSLDLDDETLWMEFDHKVRKNVKKAQRSGIVVEVDTSGCRIDDFVRLYQRTMDRREASEGYYFSRDFFDSIHRELPGQFAYFHASLGDQIVSTELVLISERSVYSYLGGTDSEAFALRPNDLLKHEIIRWARGNGKKNFVLGGGAIPGDGIERYKRSLAPAGEVEFFTGQRVLQVTAYETLVEARKTRFGEEGRVWPEETTFFPQYRLP